MFTTEEEFKIYLLRCSAGKSEQLLTLKEFEELAQIGLSMENVALFLVSKKYMEKCFAPPHCVKITPKGLDYLQEIEQKLLLCVNASR